MPGAAVLCAAPGSLPSARPAAAASLPALEAAPKTSTGGGCCRAAAGGGAPLLFIGLVAGRRRACSGGGPAKATAALLSPSIDTCRSGGRRAAHGTRPLGRLRACGAAALTRGASRLPWPQPLLATARVAADGWGGLGEDQCGGLHPTLVLSIIVAKTHSRKAISLRWWLRGRGRRAGRLGRDAAAAPAGGPQAATS
jgi:hypothetical protein